VFVVLTGVLTNYFQPWCLLESHLSFLPVLLSEVKELEYYLSWFPTSLSEVKEEGTSVLQLLLAKSEVIASDILCQREGVAEPVGCDLVVTESTESARHSGRYQGVAWE
jgi:hypothetical protein